MEIFLDPPSWLGVCFQQRFAHHVWTVLCDARPSVCGSQWQTRLRCGRCASRWYRLTACASRPRPRSTCTCAVGPPREDGFHPLLSWMVTIGLFDILEIEQSPRPGIELFCNWPDVPCDGRNLVWKAAAALADCAAEAKDGSAAGKVGLTVRLHKRIPVGAGLGGGSSDGAFALVGVNEVLGLRRSREEMSRLAARLGSDLSFFLYAPSAICRGRGEMVTPLAAPRAAWAVLILPGYGIATPAVYRRFDEMRLGDRQAIELAPDFGRWAQLDAQKLLPLLVNDLETPAFALEPRLRKLRDDAEQLAGRTVRMSGSGSSLFTLFDDEHEARTAAETVAGKTGANTIAVVVAPVAQQ